MVDATAYTKLTNLVMSQAMTLDERLACIFSQKGGKETLGNSFSIEDVISEALIYQNASG